MSLTDRMIRQAKPGVLIDGRGLRLRVTQNSKSGALRKSWLLRVKVRGGVTRELGLGSAFDLSLADARRRAQELRILARDGVDPLKHRERERARIAAENTPAPSFRECAAAYIAAHQASWKNDKHRWQWHRTLEMFAFPVFGETPVDQVDTAIVVSALEAIWYEKAETASRLRQRIEAILDWSAVRQLRAADNPARWRGHLSKVLPAPAKVKRVTHMAALPYVDIPQFMANLRAREGTSARALELTVLTASRTNEILGACWAEFDVDNAVWIIPADRMKAGREHRVPLTGPAMTLLRKINNNKAKSEFVFPGTTLRKPLSNMSMMMALRRMGHNNITVHGFRSTFRDWSAEQTAFPREVAEAALAHVVPDRVEAAYRRGDLLEKRRQLMEDWSVFCTSTQKVSSNQYCKTKQAL